MQHIVLVGKVCGLSCELSPCLCTHMQGGYATEEELARRGTLHNPNTHQQIHPPLPETNPSSFGIRAKLCRKPLIPCTSVLWKQKSMYLFSLCKTSGDQTYEKQCPLPSPGEICSFQWMPVWVCGSPQGQSCWYGLRWGHPGWPSLRAKIRVPSVQLFSKKWGGRKT